MKSPLSNLPGWDAAERMAASDDFDEQLRKAYALQPYARRFLLPREPGKPPVDPDAEQLASDVVREQVRGTG